MRGLAGVVMLLVLGAACASMPPAPAPEVTPSIETAWLDVLGVRVEPIGTGRRVTLALTREPEGIQDSSTDTPPRVVIDMEGPRQHTPAPATRFPVSDPLVSQVMVGSHDGRLRAVLELAARPGVHRVRQEAAHVIVEFGDTTAAPAEASPAAAARDETASSPDQAGPSPGDGHDAPASPWLAVRDVQVESAGQGRRLAISLTRAPDRVQEFTLPSPPRLVMDLRGPTPTRPVPPARFPLADEWVKAVRVGAHEGTVRVVADLRQRPGRFAVRAEGARLVVDLGDTGAQPALAPAEGGGIVPAVAIAPAPAASRAGEHTNGTVAPPRVVVAEPPPAVIDRAPAPRPDTERAGAAGRPGVRLASAQGALVAPEPPLAAPPRQRARRPEVARPVFRGRRISLDFKDADIQNVLRVLADVSNLNIIATDDVKGRVTLHLTDVPWDQALDLVLRSNRLEMMREGNVVRISTVERLKEEREALRAAEDAERELDPLRVEYVRVNYARADEALVEKVQGVLSDRGSVTFDERTNTVIVRDIPRSIADAVELVEQLDVQSPQVLIEANLVEATEDFARGLGVQWGYRYAAGPQTGNPTGFNFPGTVGLGGSGLGSGTPAPSPAPGVARPPVPFLADFPVPGNFGSGFGAGAGSALDLALGSIDGTHALSTRLTALEEEGKGRVISRPRVITMNNVAATIQSLTILRVKLPSTGTVINTGAGGAAGTASSATEKINTGITLVVTPQISSDGYVLMNIFAKSSQPDFSRTVDGIPNEISREANSNVLIRDGETVVLGGIYRHTSDSQESGIPYLRRVPAVGWLFKRVLQNRRREELLVFLTPRIVAAGMTPLPDAERLWRERGHSG